MQSKDKTNTESKVLKVGLMGHGGQGVSSADLITAVRRLTTDLSHPVVVIDLGYKDTRHLPEAPDCTQLAVLEAYERPPSKKSKKKRNWHRKPY